MRQAAAFFCRILRRARAGRRWWFVPVVAATLALAQIPAQASLRNAMDGMFVSTSTAPQMIETQRLRGVYGGNLNFRSPGSGISVVQFAAPRIDAGCGGIDIFFGSFSFINGAQFEQLIRAIAANAVGFAVKVAIQSMCEVCAGIIAELEAAVRELNALAKNTCAIGSAIAGVDRDKLMNRASSIGAHLAAAIGKSGDLLKAENWRLSYNPSEMAESGGEKDSSSAMIAKNNPFVGNVVYRAAQETLPKGTNVLSAFLSTQEATELVMGMFGTRIYGSDPATQTRCDNGVPEERCDPSVQDYAPTLSGWRHLLLPETSDTELAVWRCLSSDCRKVGSSPAPLNGWKGAREMVELGFFGVPAAQADVTTVTPDSLVGAFVHHVPPTYAGLNKYARAIVATSPVPLINLMQEVQDIQGGPMIMGSQLVQVFPEILAYQIASDLQVLAQNVFSAQTITEPPPFFQNYLGLRSRELAGMRPDPTVMLTLFNQAVETVGNMRSITGSPLRTNASSAR